jgi:hypothetical protein
MFATKAETLASTPAIESLDVQLHLESTLGYTYCKYTTYVLLKETRILTHLKTFSKQF